MFAPAVRTAAFARFVTMSVLAAATLAAQPLDRLTGKTLTSSGEPIRGADVHVEAINELNTAHDVMRGTDQAAPAGDLA